MRENRERGEGKGEEGRTRKHTLALSINIASVTEGVSLDKTTSTTCLKIAESSNLLPFHATNNN